MCRDQVGSAPAQKAGRHSEKRKCMTHYAQLRSAALLCVALSVFHVSTNAAPNYSGICLSPAYDFVPHKMFADAVKMGRGFAAPSGDAIPATDSSGWPLEDAGIMVWHGPVRMHGTYRLYFTTQDPAVDARTVTAEAWPYPLAITNTVYDATTNMVSGDIVVSDSGSSVCRLKFTNTQGGVRGVKLMRPEEVGGTIPCDTSVTFYPLFMQALSKFQGVRLWAVVDGGSRNMVADWSDRTTPGYCCQQNREVGGGSAGVAWEYMIQMCNEARIDLWANVQFLATDDYVRNLAELVKSTLDPQLHVYVEYANELWNWAGDYDTRRHVDSAVAEVARGGSVLNYDGDTASFTLSIRRTAERGRQISAIFRDVYGDADMMTRVRPILATQLNNGQGTLSSALWFLHDYWNNPAHVAEPHPARYYFYGAGGAPYYRPKGTYDLSTIWNSGSMDVDTFVVEQLESDITICRTFGLKRVAYEGGAICFDETDAWAAANNDSRMTSAVVEHHNAWSECGGEEFFYSDLTGWSYADEAGNFMNHIDQQATPRMLALDSLNASQRAEITVGRPVPAVLEGSTADWTAHGSPGWRTLFNTFLVRVDSAGLYGISVTVSDAQGKIVDVMLDGLPAGSFTPTASAQTGPVHALQMEQGLHAVTVLMGQNAFTVNKVAVTYEGQLGVQSLASKPLREQCALRQTPGGFVLSFADGKGTRPLQYEVFSLDAKVVQHGKTVPMAGGDALIPMRNRPVGLHVVRCGGVHVPTMGISRK